jgi:hypothetical protein
MLRKIAMAAAITIALAGQAHAEKEYLILGEEPEGMEFTPGQIIQVFGMTVALADFCEQKEDEEKWVDRFFAWSEAYADQDLDWVFYEGFRQSVESKRSLYEGMGSSGCIDYKDSMRRGEEWYSGMQN